MKKTMKFLALSLATLALFACGGPLTIEGNKIGDSEFTPGGAVALDFQITEGNSESLLIMATNQEMSCAEAALDPDGLAAFQLMLVSVDEDFQARELNTDAPYTFLDQSGGQPEDFEGGNFLMAAVYSEDACEGGEPLQIEDGEVQLTSLDDGRAAGSFTLTFDGEEVRGTFGVERCGDAEDYLEDIGADDICD